MADPQANPDASNPAAVPGEGEPISMDVIESNEGKDPVEGADEWDCFAGSGDEGEDKVSDLDNDSNNNPKKIEHFFIPRIIPRHGCKIQHSFGGLSPYFGRPMTMTNPYKVTVTGFEAPRMDIFLPGKGARAFSKSEVDDCCDRSSSSFAGLENFQVFHEVKLNQSTEDCYRHSDRTLDNYVIKKLPEEIPEPLEEGGEDDELGTCEGDHVEDFNEPEFSHEDQHDQAAENMEDSNDQDQPDQNSENMDVDEPDIQDSSEEDGDDEESSDSASDVPSGDYEQDLIAPFGAPPLTSDVIKINDTALARPETDIIVSTAKTNLYQADLATLRNDQDTRLSDPVIDFYLEMIQERYPRVYAYQSALVALLMTREGDDDEQEGEEDDDEVDIFSYDLLFAPLCHNNHWRLLVVNMKEKQIFSYNSLQYSQDKKFRLKMESHLRSKEKRRSLPESDWDSTNSKKQKNPYQNNIVDCGVFLLQFASYLCRGEAFNFGPDNMKYFRDRIIFECLKRELLQ